MPFYNKKKGINKKLILSTYMCSAPHFYYKNNYGNVDGY